MRVAQINCRKSPKSLINVLDDLISMNIDIVFLTEPPQYNDKITNLPLNSRTIYNQSTNSKFRTSIIILNNNISVMFIPNLSDNDMTTCLIKCNDYSFICSSVYMPEMADPKNHANIEIDLNKITNLINKFPDYDIIICTDSNSWHPIWGSRTSNKRGESVYECILTNNFHIANNNFNTPTFFKKTIINNETRIIESFIDLALFKSINENLIINWEISEKDYDTDHRLITFEINRNITLSNNNHIVSTRFLNTNKANWEIFEKELKRRFNNLESLIDEVRTRNQLIQIIEDFNHHLETVIKRTIPTRSIKTSKAS